MTSLAGGLAFGRGSMLFIYLGNCSGTRVLRTLLLATLLLALPALVSAREFRVADIQSEDYPTVQALQYMARLVEERTGGRHRLRVFHSRQLGEENDTIEQSRVGAIDLNRTN